MDFSEIAAVFAIVAPIIWKAVDFVKFARARDVNSTATQALVWVLGIVLLFLLSRTEFADTIQVHNQVFSQLSGATLIFIGLAGGSLASTVYDWKKATDNTDTSIVPSLLPPTQSAENLTADRRATDPSTPVV